LEQESALVLLSGGLDSVTALAWTLRQRWVILEGLSFSYGQRHVREIEAAAAIAAYYGVPHQTVALPPIAGSSLTSLDVVLQTRALDTAAATIAPTYVPNRNMIMLSYAAAHALLSHVTLLVGGWNAADAANYPDCRDEFLESTQQTLRLATLRDFTVVRPLINDDKPAIVRRALDLGAPVHLTWTCYGGGERACGTCDACQLRIAAFQHVAVIDPAPYAINIDWSGCQPYRQANV
jgi:7-cyano-7-deazaguanine synthase